MKMFGNLTTEGLEEAEDRLGGGGGIRESGIYDATVKLAYARKAANSDAMSMVIHFDIGGSEYRETYWITNKKGENFYPDSKDPTKKRQMGGFIHMEDLSLFTTEAGVADLAFTDKTVNLWDYDQKKEVPTSVPMAMDMLGKPVKIAILKEIHDKTAKDGNGDYKPTGETREVNVTDKFFHPETSKTIAEYREGVESAVFHAKWLASNGGKTRNRAKGVEGKSGTPGRPAQTTSGAPKPTKSMFAK